MLTGIPCRCAAPAYFRCPILSWARVLRLNCILWNFGESSTLVAGNEASQCSVHCAVSRLNRATPGRGQLKDSIAASFALILTISSLPIHTFKRRKLSNGTWNACSDFCRFGSSLRYGRPQLYKILAAVFEGMLRVSLGPARPGARPRTSAAGGQFKFGALSDERPSFLMPNSFRKSVPARPPTPLGETLGWKSSLGLRLGRARI